MQNFSELSQEIIFRRFRTKRSIVIYSRNQLNMAQSHVPFIFPADRFPSWDSKHDPPLPEEEFGPPLSFDPHSLDYRRGVVTGLQHPDYQFIPTAAEIRERRMDIRYNAVDDVCRRYDQPHGEPEEVKGWQRTLWRYFNLERKEEGDWNMVYLARDDTPRQNSWNAMAEYRFNLRPAGLKVKNLKIRVPFQTFRDGKVRVRVCSTDDYTTILDTMEMRPVVRAQGWDDFIIRVELSGVEDHVAFQNAQLFRQSQDMRCVNPEWKDPFRVEIEME